MNKKYIVSIIMILIIITNIMSVSAVQPSYQVLYNAQEIKDVNNILEVIKDNTRNENISYEVLDDRIIFTQRLQSKINSNNKVIDSYVQKEFVFIDENGEKISSSQIINDLYDRRINTKYAIQSELTLYYDMKMEGLSEPQYCLKQVVSAITYIPGNSVIPSSVLIRCDYSDSGRKQQTFQCTTASIQSYSVYTGNTQFYYSGFAPGHAVSATSILYLSNNDSIEVTILLSKTLR